MQKLTTFFLFLLFSWNAVAQTKITGIVTDASDGKHLTDVVIIVPNSTTGTFTDDKGQFIIAVDTTQNILIFSKVGYERKSISLNKTTTNLTIKLQRKTVELHEVKITADVAKPITKNRGLGLVDYDFWNDDTLLIVGCRNNNPSKSKLYLITEYGDTISSVAIPEKPTSLYTDCINNHYIVCTENFYEIYFDSGMIKIYPLEAITKFRNVMQPCVAAIDSMFIYSIIKGESKQTMAAFNYTTHNYLQMYVSFNRNNGKYKQFATIADRKLLRQLFEEEKRVKENYRSGLYRSAFDAQMDFMFAHKILFKEVFAPLFKIDTLLYIFNFSESMIQSFTGLPNHINNVPLQFGDERDFKRAIYQDRKNQKLYAGFLSNGINELRYIDVANGELKMGYLVKKHFAENIRIRNNNIYFLYKDFETDDVRVLYKQQME